MIDYRIVKYCGLCKTRFLVNKGENKKIYCEKCYAKIIKSRQEEKKLNSENKNK